MRSMSAPAVMYPKRGLPRTSDTEEANKLLGTLIDLQDGSTWKLTKALSDVKYQQTEPPFEATQVFTCALVADPKQAYPGIAEAVVKVKYQIKPLHSYRNFFRDHLEDREAALEERHSAEEFVRRLKGVEYWRKQHRLATTPVTKSSDFYEHSVSENNALTRFSTTESKYTPRLLASMWLCNTPPGDCEYMPGGYVLYMLMTKLPAQQITHKGFARMNMEEREEIRKAFKIALTDIWSLGIGVMGGGLHNLMWDKEHRKCYIVDFKDSCNLHDRNGWKPTWSDQVIQDWELEEIDFSHWCYGNDTDESDGSSLGPDESDRDY